MSIPNDKVEDMAVRMIETLADETTALIPRISSHDKDISYDGYIELYKNGTPHNKENYGCNALGEFFPSCGGKIQLPL